MHEQYVARKQETNSMDFDDLLLNVVRLFQEQEHLRALYGSRFQHILVDEYQDTNYLQSRFIDPLPGGKDLQDRDQLPQRAGNSGALQRGHRRQRGAD